MHAYKRTSVLWPCHKKMITMSYYDGLYVRFLEIFHLPFRLSIYSMFFSVLMDKNHPFPCKPFCGKYVSSGNKSASVLNVRLDGVWMCMCMCRAALHTADTECTGKTSSSSCMTWKHWKLIRWSVSQQYWKLAPGGERRCELNVCRWSCVFAYSVRACDRTALSMETYWIRRCEPVDHWNMYWMW